MLAARQKKTHSRVEPAILQFLTQRTSLKYFFFGSLLLLINVGHTFFTELSANTDGSLPYNASTAALLCEIFKAMFIIPLLARLRFADPTAEHLVITSGVVYRMAIPAFLYTVVNIASYHAIGFIGSTKYQMYSNLKIFATAVAFRFMLKKPLNVLHWFFITLLMAGLLVGTVQPTSGQRFEKNVAVGIFLVSIVCISSAVASVYFELQLKTAKEHPLIQNLLLYFWTSVLCLSAQLFQKEAGQLRTFFEEQNFYIWCAVLSSAIYGQVVSLTLYYCDNMAKVFASSLAVFASALLDLFFFGKRIGFNSYMGGLLAFMATIGYYCRHDSLLQEDVTFINHQTNSSRVFTAAICLMFGFLLLSSSKDSLLRVDIIE